MTTKITPGSDNYYSLIKLPKSQANEIKVIIELFDNLLSIPTSVSDDQIAHAKLQWWSQELSNIAHGKGSHPISQNLYNIIKNYQINPGAFGQAINTIENTLQDTQFKTEQDLRNYYTYTAGIKERMIAKITFPESPQYTQAIYSLAYCLGLINNLKVLRINAKKLYGFFSDEELNSLSMQKAELFSFITNRNIEKLIILQINKAKEAYKNGLNALPEKHHKQLRCLITRCKLALAWAKLLKSENYQVLEKQISLTAIRKFFIAF